MEINKNSFLARYYMFMFNNNLPKDFCTLFWNTPLSIILIPLAIPYRIDKNEWFNSSLTLKTIFGTVWWVLILFIGSIGGMIIENLGWTGFIKLSIFLIIPLGLIVMLIRISIISAL